MVQKRASHRPSRATKKQNRSRRHRVVGEVHRRSDQYVIASALRSTSLFCLYLIFPVLKTGLISQANGSAYVEMENTKIACAVCVTLFHASC